MISALEDFPSQDPASNTALFMACSAALLTLLPIAAHQLGGLNHLADPPGSVFASDKITESAAAHPLGIPDSILGLGSYGVTLGLVVHARRHPQTRKVLALKLLADGSLASFNVVRQAVTFRRLCSWCTGTAICTAVMMLAGRRLIGQQISATREQLRSHSLQRAI